MPINFIRCLNLSLTVSFDSWVVLPFICGKVRDQKSLGDVDIRYIILSIANQPHKMFKIISYCIFWLFLPFICGKRSKEFRWPNTGNVILASPLSLLVPIPLDKMWARILYLAFHVPLGSMTILVLENRISKMNHYIFCSKIFEPSRLPRFIWRNQKIIWPSQNHHVWYGR